MEPTVQVMMSTYNGEKYLREQIDSVIRQEDINVRLLVRDDGSSDATQSILDDYQRRGLLEWKQGNNIGWAESFMQLVCEAPDADFYALCDQDDIWLPDKLKAAVSHLNTMGEGCNLYGSNLHYYKNGTCEGLVYQGNRATPLAQGLIRCMTAGCTMVFNRTLRDALRAHPPQFVFAHDFWIYTVALATGHVCYDEESHILYRQHENNQIGDKRTAREIWMRRAKEMKTIGRRHDRERMATELLRCFGDEMSAENRAIVDTVANYRHSLRKKTSLLSSSRFTTGNVSNDFWLKLRILFNRL